MQSKIFITVSKGKNGEDNPVSAILTLTLGFTVHCFLMCVSIYIFLMVSRSGRMRKIYTYSRLRRSFATAATSETKYIHGIWLKELLKPVNFLTIKNSKPHLNLMWRMGSEKNRAPQAQDLTATGPTASILQITDLQASDTG